ncbi:MAG: amidase [Rhodospirillaceae bacterium]
MTFARQVAWISAIGLGLAACSPGKESTPVAERSMTDLSADFAAGKVTSEALTRAYLARIKTEDKATNAVLAINPKALDAAKAADERHKAGKSLGPLDGMTILLKDNIDFAGMPTTAGSLALKDNLPPKDSPMVKRLLDAGMVVLGKANLSEWANFRSNWSTSGWTGVAGLTRNPYDLARTASGSSSGSGAAAASSLAAVTIGTETNGSVTSPANVNGIVGLKPTVGLVSRTGIVPISHNQDTAGPMTRTVADNAALLTAMAGSDPADPATAEADAHKTDYLKGLNREALKGARLGVMRFQKGYTPKTTVVYEAALEALKAQGAVLVDITDFKFEDLSKYGQTILNTDFKEDVKAYLVNAPAAVKTRTLADLIAFNKATPRELLVFGQDRWEAAEKTTGFDDPLYKEAVEVSQRTTGPEGIDKLLKDYDVVALIQPTGEPASLIDSATGQRTGGGPSASGAPAIAGYPHLTVPMGNVSGLPVGLSFIGPKWSEQTLLSLGYAFEQATHARKAPDGKAGKMEF